MTITAWNLPHGYWSKNLTMATVTLEFALRLNILTTINFDNGHDQNLDP